MTHTIINNETILGELKIKKVLFEEKQKLIKDIINDCGGKIQKDWIRNDYLKPIEEELLEVIEDIFFLEQGKEINVYLPEHLRKLNK